MCLINLMKISINSTIKVQNLVQCIIFMKQNYFSLKKYKEGQGDRIFVPPISYIFAVASPWTQGTQGDSPLCC